MGKAVPGIAPPAILTHRAGGQLDSFCSSLALQTDVCEHLRATSVRVSGHELGDDRRDLVTALGRRFDWVGIVRSVATDEPKINQRQCAGKRGAGNDIVEDGESG